MTEIHLPQLLAEAFGVSRSEARRKLSQGAFKLNGEPVEGWEIESEDLNGELTCGRRQSVQLSNGEIVE